MNVLVTGGAGYIGSHTCKALARAGHRPIVVDNLIYGHREAVKWGPFFELDIHETERLSRLMSEEEISAVVHFAAFAYVGESVSAPLKYYENNVAGSLSLFAAMKKAGVKSIVFSSTCATYGIPDGDTIEETFEQRPINPYGESKLIVERILRDLGAAGDLVAVCLRYFNAAGADADLEVGECHDPETHLIPLVIEAAFRSDLPITVFGTDYPTPDGTCVRDFIHVTDLADAHVRALDSFAKADSSWRAYNLGTGRGASVREVIRSVESITGRKVAARDGARRFGDPPYLVASPGRANEDLGWEARHSDLENILRTAIAWYKRKSEIHE